MIVPMKKVFVVTRASEREALLGALRDLGVLHLEPADPSAAAPEQLRSALRRVQQAEQALAAVAPSGEAPDLSASEAAEEVLTITRRVEEHRSRLAALYREAEGIRMWGDLRRDRLDALAEAGLEVRFYAVPAEDAGEVRGECVERLGDLPGGRVLVAVARREGAPDVPDSAELLSPPRRDRPTILAEARRADEALAADMRRLGELAHLAEKLEAERRRLASEVAFAAALAGGMQEADLFGVQGWAPAGRAETLADDLARQGIAAGVDTREPAPGEQPPTLIGYPAWARPIKGLFDMLGTVAGYREFDVAAPFMIALPIFAAMLIGDGGYGLVLLLGPALAYRRAARMLGAEFTRLLLVVGGAAVAWGLLNGSFFGVVLYDPVIPVDMSEQSRNLVMRISFYMGAVHLSLAQLWAGVALWPSLKMLSKVGWAVFVWGMLGVVKYFVLNDAYFLDPSTPWPYLLGAGAALAIVFASPSRNPAKMLGVGLAGFPLSMLSTFSDVISYVRLMAVGLASGVLAASFNELAVQSGTWIIGVPVLVAGHALNIGLCVIALFAHGVRLNMLEFSNNLGMQWGGYAYQPFAYVRPEETTA